MKNLIILGVGGFAREVYDLAQGALGYETEWKIKGFLDGTTKLSFQEYALLNAPVLGDVTNYDVQEDDVFICAVANVRVKKLLTEIIEKKGGEFINIIHKTALVSNSSKMGIGVVLAIHTGISCNTDIGNHVMINAYSGVGHDAKIGSYTSIMSHVDITGNTCVGEFTYWGSGSRTLPGSKIGNGASIGVGSVVLRRVKENEKVFGVPAQPIPFNYVK